MTESEKHKAALAAFHHYMEHEHSGYEDDIWLAAWQASRAALGVEWISVEERLPECDMTPNSFGVQVGIYPPYKSEGSSDTHFAFYGCRQTDEPNFYVYGRLIAPTHWRYLPEPPAPKVKP